MPKYTINYLDCCTPSYFNGSSNPVDCMPVDGNTKVSDIMEWMDNDAFDGAAFYGEDVDYEALDVAVKEYAKEHADKLDKVAFPSIDIPSEDDDADCYEGCYAYFELVKCEDIEE